MTALMKNSSAVDQLVEFLVPNSNTGPAIVKGRGAEVEDESGRRFWVFREGLYAADLLPAWFLHGLFA